MPRTYIDITKADDLPSAGSDVNTDITYAHNLEAAFRRIRTRAEYMAIRDGDQFAGSRYTVREVNEHGFLNHFQGLQRLGNGRYFVISGGDWQRTTQNSHLFIIKVGSQSTVGSIHSNIMFDKNPPLEDYVIKTIGINTKLWHAGGMDMLGDLLVVPVEHMTDDRVRFFAQAGPTGPDNSRIVFFDMADPENPKFFKNYYIDRPEVKVGAAAVTKLNNGHILVAAWSDSDKLPPRLEFYLSDDPDFPSFSTRSPTIWMPDDIKAIEGQTETFGKFQAINFVHEKEGLEGEQLYLLGFRKSE